MNIREAPEIDRRIRAIGSALRLLRGDPQGGPTPREVAQDITACVVAAAAAQAMALGIQADAELLDDMAEAAEHALYTVARMRRPAPGLAPFRPGFLLSILDALARRPPR